MLKKLACNIARVLLLNDCKVLLQCTERYLHQDLACLFPLCIVLLQGLHDGGFFERF